MAFDSWRKNYIPEDPHEMYLTEGDLEMAYKAGEKAATAAEREAGAVLCDELAAEYNVASRNYSVAVTRTRWNTIERTALILAEEIRRRGKEPTNA